jgi:hypothetical protein
MGVHAGAGGLVIRQALRVAGERDSYAPHAK